MITLSSLSHTNSWQQCLEPNRVHTSIKYALVETIRKMGPRSRAASDGRGMKSLTARERSKWTMARTSRRTITFAACSDFFSSNGLVNISASWSLVPTLSIQMSHFIDDLLWNGGGHQYALFLHVELDCLLAWLHSYCHIAMALSWT